MDAINALVITEPQLHGYLSQKYEEIHRKYNVLMAIKYAKYSKAGKKLRKDEVTSTFDGHLSIATILATKFAPKAGLKVSPSLIIEMLLHDCIEDGDKSTVKEMYKNFGRDVTTRVIRLSKTGFLPFNPDNERLDKRGIHYGLQSMRNQSVNVPANSYWRELTMEENMQRLKESNDLQLQVEKLADRGGNLFTDWWSVVHTLPDNNDDYQKFFDKKIDYIKETRDVILAPFMYDEQLAYPIQYNLNTCYQIEKRFQTGRARYSYKEYYEDWCHEQEQRSNN